VSKLPLLLVAGYFLLTLSWALANPPFAAPDEDDHYIRALGLSTGDIRGRQTTPVVPPGATPDVRAFYTEHPEFWRTVRVPHGLMAAGVTCESLAPEKSAACLDDTRVLTQNRLTTLMAGYEPAPYVLPAAAARLASSPFAGLRLGRLASAITSLLLVALGVLLLWSRALGPLSLTGAVVALTPMAIFSASSLNPSGPEITAGFAFAAALLRLARGDAPRWASAGAAVAGAALALSRSPSPAWILLDVLLFVALVGRAPD